MKAFQLRMAAGAAGGAFGAALYGGSADDIIGAAIKGAVIGAFAGAVSAAANAYFGAVGTQTTTASGVGSIATHGAIAGARQAAEGGNFWTGFEAGLIATAVSTYGPQEMGYTGNVVKSSLIGGTTSAINGEKFANGAILGAFSADFRTWVEGRSSLVGKIWALPNTVLGLAVGLVENGAGLIEGTHPEWSFGNNSLQLLNAPWGSGGAISLLASTVVGSWIVDVQRCADAQPHEQIGSLLPSGSSPSSPAGPSPRSDASPGRSMACCERQPPSRRH
jgi:hypothetical protein